MEVLLGLLTVEPMSGYDLRLTIRASIGHFWNESYGQIYPGLKKLQDEGFVTCKIKRQKHKPDRRIYSITKKGRERLTEWLAVPPQPDAAPKPPLLVDVERHVARLDDKDLQLTPIELRLLALLQSTPGRIYRRDHLLRHLITNSDQVFTATDRRPAGRLRRAEGGSPRER